MTEKKHKAEEKKKDASYANLAFIFALLFWIPLFSMFLIPLSIVFSILALKKIKKDPTHYCGSKRAITGLVISIIWIIVTIVAIIYLGFDTVFQR